MGIVSNKLDWAVKQLGELHFPGMMAVCVGERPGIRRKPAPDVILAALEEDARAAGFADAGDDATTVAIGPADEAARISVEGPLGGQFLLWEFATALAGRLLGIDPFDQPDVEAAKKAL